MNLSRIMKQLMLCCLGLLASSALYALQVSDDRGMVLDLPSPAKRVVSLLPSLSEMVCALQACDHLVGVDRNSNFPLTLKNVASLGSGLDPNIEAIVLLRPDVVVMSHAPRAVERLNSLGVKVLVLEPKTHADVERVLQSLATLLGVDGAQKLWRSIEAEINDSANSMPLKSKGVRVYFEVNRGPYAASESSFIGEILSRLGTKNIIPASLGPFPLVNPEFIVKANPEVIFITAQEASTLSSRPGWGRINAVQNKHVCVIANLEEDIIARPGPRMGQAAAILAHCLLIHGRFE